MSRFCFLASLRLSTHRVAMEATALVGRRLASTKPFAVGPELLLSCSGLRNFGALSMTRNLSSCHHDKNFSLLPSRVDVPSRPSATTFEALLSVAARIRRASIGSRRHEPRVGLGLGSLFCFSPVACPPQKASSKVFVFRHAQRTSVHECLIAFHFSPYDLLRVIQ